MLPEYTPDAQRKAGCLGRNEHLAQSRRSLSKYVLEGRAAEPEGTGVDGVGPGMGPPLKLPLCGPSPLCSSLTNFRENLLCFSLGLSDDG